MLSKVRLEYFKKFESQEFRLDDSVVLAGPNNSGKTTLLQGVATWGMCLRRWLDEYGGSKSRATLRTGIPLVRSDFTAIPLREMNLLWCGRSTAYSKGEKPDLKGGEPKLLRVMVWGEEKGTEWNLCLQLRYSSREQVYVNFTDVNDQKVSDVPEGAKGVLIAHVPPFSGIGAEETRYDRGYQDGLVGQGKPGDILRNLLLEVCQAGNNQWEDLNANMKVLFNCELCKPRYTPADRFIVIEYRDLSGGGSRPLDLAAGGSGFGQVLTLLGFIYARPASVLLVDEPDAHEHVVLQRQVYDLLRRVARERKCQLIISTHSEVIVEETHPERIMSFYGQPHRLEVDDHRNEIREALKRLGTLDILEAERGQNILYVESESDFKILEGYARALGHDKMTGFFKSPFFFVIRGSNVRVAREHLFALRAIRREIRGVLLLDRDNRDVAEHEVRGEGLEVLRWGRYEIENYLLHPETLCRFVGSLEKELELYREARMKACREYLTATFPPDAYNEPLGENAFLTSVAASKEVLPKLFESLGVSISRNEYYQVAAQMKKEEIHPEIKEKLDQMAGVLLGG